MKKTPELIQMSELHLTDFVVTQENRDKGKVFKLARLSAKEIASWRSQVMELVEHFEGIEDTAEEFSNLTGAVNLVMSFFSYLAYVDDEVTQGALRVINASDALEQSTVTNLYLATIELHKDIIPPEFQKLAERALTAAVKRDGPSAVFEDRKN